MDAFLKDLRHSVRMFLHTPGFTIVVIAALALGIGTNTAMFSVVDTVLLKPGSDPNVDRMVIFQNVFKGGRGFDGLVNATALAVMSRRATVQTAVYLLPLRHPVPVARQVASLAALAPGRLEFGVGIGGEDPAETRACGIDPATRGRRRCRS